MSVIHMFPGQGSQKVGMGKELFSRYKDKVKQADDYLGYSIEKLCTEDPDGQLNNTAFTQPALYTVNALSFMDIIEEGYEDPAITIGHSLGEYNALFAAGAFDFLTGLKLVHKRGAIMSKVTGGGMAAVLGMDADKVREVLASSETGKAIDLANINSPEQMVISGKKEDIENIEQAFLDAGAKRFVPLAVSGAFHSRYMKEPAEEFAKFLEGVEIKAPKIPVIANVTAQPYEAGKEKELLVSQIYSSVRWVETITYCKGQASPTFEEVGPGNVLRGLLRKMK